MMPGNLRVKHALEKLASRGFNKIGIAAERGIRQNIAILLAALQEYHLLHQTSFVQAIDRCRA